MTGLDTNIIVRYIMQDDPVQSAKANRIIEREFTEQDPAFISLASVLEIAWVLKSFYGLSSQQVAQVMERMLQIESLNIQNEHEVSAATRVLKTGQGSFEDALIGALGAWADCDSTLTFDKKASRLQGFELIR
jgi:predicted nucleic-acid-binding protein